MEVKKQFGFVMLDRVIAQSPGGGGTLPRARPSPLRSPDDRGEPDRCRAGAPTDSTAPHDRAGGVTAIWGSTFVVVSRAIEQMPAVTFLAWRFGLATLVLILLRPRSLRLLDRRDLVRGLWMGMALGLGYILQTVGLYTTPVTVSGFITGMFLVFTPIVAWVLLREPIPSSAWWAVGIATVGLAVMSLNGFSMGLGELLTLGGALAFAVQIVGLSAFSTPAKAYPWQSCNWGVTALMCTIGSHAGVGAEDVPPTRDVWVSLLFWPWPQRRCRSSCSPGGRRTCRRRRLLWC